MSDAAGEPETLAELADWIEAQVKVAAAVPVPALRFLAYAALLDSIVDRLRSASEDEAREPSVVAGAACGVTDR